MVFSWTMVLHAHGIVLDEWSFTEVVQIPEHGFTELEGSRRYGTNRDEHGRLPDP
jgi:hypothetical protein